MSVISCGRKHQCGPRSAGDGGCCSPCQVMDRIFIARAWWTYHRDSTAMQEVESEIVAGQHATACRNIEKLLSWKADPNGAIHYLLGSCELARGRGQAAGAAWSRVLPGSEFSERAIEGRMHLFYESGQFAGAEKLIHDAAGDPRNDRTALLVLLVPIYALIMGRPSSEARQTTRRLGKHT